ncbi:MAG: asparagine--tRNA ligase [Proteobacteria bacterium]|nr:asparagine--tRNA ligase [Pseudomonadota bacterium]MBU1715887.1 asparagine--tRNA ligase [Pseudomonadota bacterium]
MNIAKILQSQPDNGLITIKGWVKTRRDSKKISFIEVNDGSCLANLQVIAEDILPNYEEQIQHLSAGCSIKVTGHLTSSPAKGQNVELHATAIKIYGWAPPEDYPLQKKRHSFEFLRTIPHLRPRTNSLGAMTRIRSKLSFAVHHFFNQHDFVQVHTPIITTSDCEGAGEMFTVTALDLTKPETIKEGLFHHDFFGRQAGLTVSGQLEAEAYALALGKVYTFGPTFRAENSNTSRHLAEFWMIEPEMAFCDLTQNITMAEQLLKSLISYVITNCAKDLELFNRFIEKGLSDKLENIIKNDFDRITYSEAITELTKSGRPFNFPVEWGADLQSEHERFLTEEVFNGPLVVTDYPKTIKPFYMRQNDDHKTVAAMDILFPGIGEIVGGSQREERYEQLAVRMDEMKINREDYKWYLDLRRYGSAPHAGFGLGFERLVQFVTGISNIRDVIPFPRTPRSAAGD